MRTPLFLLSVLMLVRPSIADEPAAPAPTGGAMAAGAGQVVLNESSPWRCFYAGQSPVRRRDGALEVVTRGAAFFNWTAQTPPPPADWMKPDYLDAQWLRWRMGKPHDKMFDYGFYRSDSSFSLGPTVALECLRGRFKVEDPTKVQNMTLSMNYRGGVVVYLNGKEIARGHLPKEGEIDPLALADDYPPEAFVKADGKTPIRSGFHEPEVNADRVEKRIRGLAAIAIGPGDLRKGVNVLAIESHRAPQFGSSLESEAAGNESVWRTCGLVSLELRAAAGAEPNIVRPPGIQVWNTSVMTRSSPYAYGDPCEPLDPVLIPATRNGSFTGKLVVSSDAALRGVKAECADLVHKDGKGKISATAVKILYVIRDDRTTCRYRAPAGGFWDTLVESPPAEQPPADKGGGAMQPIWVKVRVPADAAPGEYRGVLTIRAEGLNPVEAPVRVSVADWELPDSRDWTGGHLALVQSPETLALFYKVTPWSEEHWKLIEESFKLMGELGNRYAVIPLICRTNFGNEQSMVRWVKDGDSYKRDYAVFDRYLDLTQKYMKPDVICLYIWDRYTGEVLNARGHPGNLPNNAWGPTLVTRLDPATGKSEDMEAPPHGSVESKAFWAPACKEIRQRLEKRGLLGVTMMGINGDMYMPTQQIADMLAELMPGMKWVSNAHAGKYGEKIMKVLPVGYNTFVYSHTMSAPTDLSWDEKRKVGWRMAAKQDIFPRGAVTNVGVTPVESLGVWRLTVEAVVVGQGGGNDHGCSGMGRTGMDFWPVGCKATELTRDKRSETINSRYPPDWGQINMDVAGENTVAPGPNGALPTERFENLREGMQETEARAFIERAVIEPALRAKLREDLAKKCQRLLDERHWRLRNVFYMRTAYELADTEQLRDELFELAAEVAAKLGAK